MVGVLCNDDVRARASLGALLDIQPGFLQEAGGEARRATVEERPQGGRVLPRKCPLGHFGEREREDDFRTGRRETRAGCDGGLKEGTGG